MSQKKPKEQYISIVEYARYRGLSQPRISELVKTGTINHKKIDRRKMIDWKLADEEYAKKVDVSSRNFAYLENEKLTKGKKSKGTPDIYSSKAVKEQYNAELAKLEYEQKSGMLLSTEEVKKEAFVLAKAVRNAILNVPQKIAAEIASEIDPHEVEVMLGRELREALEQLSQGRFVDGDIR